MGDDESRDGPLGWEQRWWWWAVVVFHLPAGCRSDFLPHVLACEGFLDLWIRETRLRLSSTVKEIYILKKTELKHQTGGEKRRVRYLTGDTPGSKQNRKHTKRRRRREERVTQRQQDSPFELADAGETKTQSFSL